MKWLHLFEKYKKDEKIHVLSGIALIVDNKILLVHPKKFKNVKDRWSIPKGHIEGANSLKSALKELEEESGIKLNKKFDRKISIDYKKSGIIKLMDVYVYNLDKTEVKKYLGKEWEIKKKWFDSKEIWKCKFFSYDDARQSIELGMMDIIDDLELELPN